MSQNQIMFAIACVPENAELIDQVSKLVLGADYTAEAPKNSHKTTSEEKPKSTGVSLTDLKEAAKAAKAEFGEDFCKQVLEDAGVEPKPTLARSVSAIPEKMYDSIIAAWKSGPQESEEDDLDDAEDDLDDAEDIDPEAVKTALKAYAKKEGRDEAKEVMSKHGVTKLSDVDGLDSAKLTKLFKAVV